MEHLVFLKYILCMCTVTISGLCLFSFVSIFLHMKCGFENRWNPTNLKDLKCKTIKVAGMTGQEEQQPPFSPSVASLLANQFRFETKPQVFFNSRPSHTSAQLHVQLYHNIYLPGEAYKTYDLKIGVTFILLTFYWWDDHCIGNYILIS